MEQYSNIIIYSVIIVAFLIGYSVVSFIIKRLQQLKNMPPLNEEIWKQQSKAEMEKEQREEVFRRQDQKSLRNTDVEKESKADWTAEGEEDRHE